MGKSLIKSKTAWVNFIIAVAVAVGSSFDVPGITAFAQSPLAITIVSTVVNAVLRLITKEPITSIV